MFTSIFQISCSIGSFQYNEICDPRIRGRGLVTRRGGLPVYLYRRYWSEIDIYQSTLCPIQIKYDIDDSTHAMARSSSHCGHVRTRIQHVWYAGKTICITWGQVGSSGTGALCSAVHDFEIVNELFLVFQSPPQWSCHPRGKPHDGRRIISRYGQ